MFAGRKISSEKTVRRHTMSAVLFFFSQSVPARESCCEEMNNNEASLV